MLTLVSPPDDSVPPSVESAEPRVEPKEPKYWAFLSYSHHDKVAAKRLQKQLETYKVPRRLVGRDTSHGPVPARVSPVFRDRDELHAGADLKASVQDALSRSRWLIVICTPDSARSPWVNREIIEFKRMHGERRVLALIVRGEPFASDMPGREAEECFPPALRRALTADGLPEGEPLEPIAADMRKQGDGEQRAVLKLLAGMLGVAFDDLVRRDMQRRVRVLSGIASASALGVVVFAFMAVMAVKARNEAQHQRLQAEGLIEFMLGDLRKKLEPVGRLEVLDSVGEKALAYYGEQESDKLDATALGHRSRAMHLIGEIRDLRGNPVEAQKAFEQAAATTAQLLAQAPNDGRRLFDHAQSAFWVGYTAWKQADGRTAERWLNEYLQLALRLTNLDPANVDWRAEVAFAHVNLGVVQLGVGHAAEALKSLQLAGELLTDLVAKRPDLQFELAQNHGWQANAYELLGDYDHALMEQHRKLELFRDMPNAEKNAAVQKGILNATETISRYQLALGRVADAELSARAGLQIGDKLVRDDPKNLFWRSDACVAHLTLAEVQMILANAVEAVYQLGLASDCVSRFNDTGTLSIRYTISLKARELLLSARLVPDYKRTALAIEIDTFLTESMSKLTSGTPDRSRLAVELANVAIVLGSMQAPLSEQQAISSWRRAEVLLKPYAELNDGAILTPLARAQFHLGDSKSAHALVERIRRTSYRHPAYADLVKQLQAGRGGSTALQLSGVGS